MDGQTNPGGTAVHAVVPAARERLREVLELALRAGQLMLESGANTARVEDTVQAIGLGLGAERIDAYVTPTGIVATVVAGEEHRTRIVRILHHGINLARVAAIARVAADVSSGVEWEPARVRARLGTIAEHPRAWGPLFTVLAAGVACGCFCRLLGGGPLDAVIALLGAMMGQGVRERLRVNARGRLLGTLAVAIVAAAVSVALVRWWAPHLPGVAVVSSVLLLVPGVLMVSSVADLLRGDIVSGLGRATLAALMVSAAGSGIWLVLEVSRTQLTLTPGPAPLLPVGGLYAAIAAAGFAMLFQAPVRAILLAAPVAACAWMVRRALLDVDVGTGMAMFAAGLTVALLAELLSRRAGLPISLLSIPAFIPLVPGLVAFQSVLELGRGDYLAGTATLVRSLLWVGAVAAGLGGGTVLVRRGNAMERQRAGR